MDEQLLSLEEAAKIAGCSASQLRLVAKNGTLKATKVGKYWVVSLAQLRVWMQNEALHKTGPKKPKNVNSVSTS